MRDSLSLKVQDFHEQPEVVFLHGWGVNNGVFEGLLPQLMQQHGVRFIDLPGFGRNHHIDISDHEFPHFCDLIAELLPEKAILVGWSLGGLVAQQIAATHADKVSKIVLICSSPWFMDEASPDEHSGWRGIKPQILENFQSQLSGDFKKTLERFLAIQSLGSETARSDLKTIKAQIFQHPQPGSVALKKGLEYLQTVDLRHRISALNCDTLRIFGSQDSLVPKQAVEKIQALQPKAHYHVIKGASHAPFISHSQQFMQVFNGFL